MSKDLTQLEALNYKARSIARGRLLERFRDTVQEIVDHADNEGDRVYFGTTNHFDTLKDIALQMESWNWDRVAHERREIDPYAEMRACRKEVADTIAMAAAKDAEIAKLREAIDQLWKEAESAYCQALGRLSKTECLGWEEKVRTQTFGKAEYDAHKKANELIGRHHGIAHAVKTIRSSLEGGAA